MTPLSEQDRSLFLRMASRVIRNAEILCVDLLGRMGGMVVEVTDGNADEVWATLQPLLGDRPAERHLSPSEALALLRQQTAEEESD